MSGDRDEQLEEIARWLFAAEDAVVRAVNAAGAVRSALPANFVRQCGKILSLLIERRQDVYDVRPDLADDLLAPEGAARALDRVIAELRDAGSEAQSAIMAELAKFVPARLVAQMEAAGSVARAEILADWWGRQELPFVSPIDLHRGLRHERRYYRLRTARFIDRRYGCSVLNEAGDDVDLGKGEAWFAGLEEYR